MVVIVLNSPVLFYPFDILYVEDIIPYVLSIIIPNTHEDIKKQWVK